MFATAYVLSGVAGQLLIAIFGVSRADAAVFTNPLGREVGLRMWFSGPPFRMVTRRLAIAHSWR
jgi:hypothetical protein